MNDETPPPFAVIQGGVTGDGREQYDLEQAEENLSWRVRALAANLLRVIAGAGKDYEIIENCADLIQAAHAYLDLRSGPEVFSIMAIALTDRDWRKQDSRYTHKRQLTAESMAEDRVVQHALRFVAAQLLHQTTQESTNEGDLHLAARQLTKAIDDDNARILGEWRK